MPLILASQSVGRKHLLQLFKIPFEIIPSALDEEKIVGRTPLETVKMRAKLKGEDILNKITQYSNNPINTNKPKNHDKQLTTNNSHLTTIISADSGAILDNQLIGKPKDYTDAVRIMKMLSGKTHRLVTTVHTIYFKAGDSREGFQTELHLAHAQKLNNNVTAIEAKFGKLERQDPRTFQIQQFTDSSLVTFRKLTDKKIKIYLGKTDYTRYAGGYALFDCPDCRFPTLEELLTIHDYHQLLTKTCRNYPHNHSNKSLIPDFIAKIEGSMSNVIGLPLEKLITNNHLTI